MRGHRQYPHIVLEVSTQPSRAPRARVHVHFLKCRSRSPYQVDHSAWWILRLRTGQRESYQLQLAATYRYMHDTPYRYTPSHLHPLQQEPGRRVAPQSALAGRRVTTCILYMIYIILWYRTPKSLSHTDTAYRSGDRASAVGVRSTVTGEVVCRL